MLEPFKSYLNHRAERLNSYQPATAFTIFHNANGAKLSWFKSFSDRGESVIAWRDTVRVEAFKRDLYAVDLICLRFVLSDRTAVVIDEEMDGWTSLADKLPEYLPGCQKFEEWFLVVAFPAFKPNLTIIYKRNESQPESLRSKIRIKILSLRNSIVRRAPETRDNLQFTSGIGFRF